MLASDVLSGRSGPKVFPWFWQILLISSTTIASRLIFARGTRPRKVRSELRSPSVVTRAAASRRAGYGFGSNRPSPGCS